jgi:hypothetical protein
MHSYTSLKMKKLLFGLTALFLFINVNAQIANAGTDQRIYLTQTSSATLNGSASSGDTYQWTDISTDQVNPAKIILPFSAVSSVTGLVQGTWYYQLAVTSAGVTKRDTVVVRVDYDVPPANSTLLRYLPIAAIAPWANIRDDTTKYWSGGADPSPYKRSMFTDASGNIFLQRDRTPGMHVDSARGKFYSTIEDGYSGTGTYARSELHLGSSWGLDSNKTYVFEWKGYFPQSIRSNMPYIIGEYPKDKFAAVLAIMQWHGHDDYSGPFQIRMMQQEIQFEEWSGRGNGSDAVTTLMTTTDANVMKTHTYRVTMKQGKGYPGQKAFIKVEVDGVQKYFRNTGQVGQTLQHDYPKFSSLYDASSALVNPDSLSRGKKFSLVTEEYRIYQINNIPAP